MVGYVPLFKGTPVPAQGGALFWRAPVNGYKNLTIKPFPEGSEEHALQKGKANIRKKVRRAIEDCLKALKKRGVTMYC